MFIKLQMKFILQVRPERRAMQHAFLWLVGLALIAPLTGCGRDDIQVYHVPKESSPARGVSVAANVPEGWEAVPPGEMRVASFRVQSKAGKTADVSVIPLPGLAGRDIDNVNRWRGQVGLAPVAEAELPKLGQTVQIGGLEGQLYDMAGENAAAGEKSRILAAVVRHEGAAWFFKMTGDSDLVAQQKPAFVSYLKSYSFPSMGGEQTGSAPTSTELPPSHPPIGGVAPFAANQAGSQLPPSHPPIGTMPEAAAGPISHEGQPDWQVPASWKEIPGGQFLVAKFIVPAGDSQATINVSSSAGTGGGLAMNVNRWRGQIGLGQLSEDDVNRLAKTVDTGSGKANLVDMSGTDPKNGQKTRVLGVVVPQGQQTWFYKLMGPDQAVEANKDAFLAFVKTVKYR
jgi:hypothetical protein